MIEHTSNTCSIVNEIKYDVDDADQKHQLYKQFFAWCCNICSIVPLTDYANNPIFQKHFTEKQKTC